MASAPAPEWEDLDAFLSLDEFAVDVRIETYEAGALVADVVGIFDAPYVNAELGEYDMDTVQPRVTCKASDVEMVQRGHVAIIGGKQYDLMSGPEYDGTGMAVLMLAAR